MPDNETWNRIRLWPGLSAEAKLAWLCLWDSAGAKPAIVRAILAFIGADQGADDPERFARRFLSQLAEAGLVEITQRDETVWTLGVLDPAATQQRQKRAQRAVRGGL